MNEILFPSGPNDAARGIMRGLPYDFTCAQLFPFCLIILAVIIAIITIVIFPRARQFRRPLLNRSASMLRS